MVSFFRRHVARWLTLGCLGRQVGRSPVATLLIPLLVTAALFLSNRLDIFLHPNKDIWHLFVPSSATALDDRAAIERALNGSAQGDRFVPGGATRTEGLLQVIAVAKSGARGDAKEGLVLEEKFWREVIGLALDIAEPHVGVYDKVKRIRGTRSAS